MPLVHASFPFPVHLPPTTVPTAPLLCVVAVPTPEPARSEVADHEAPSSGAPSRVGGYAYVGSGDLSKGRIGSGIGPFLPLPLNCRPSHRMLSMVGVVVVQEVLRRGRGGTMEIVPACVRVDVECSDFLFPSFAQVPQHFKRTNTRTGCTAAPPNRSPGALVGCRAGWGSGDRAMARRKSAAPGAAAVGLQGQRHGRLQQRAHAYLLAHARE